MIKFVTALLLASALGVAVHAGLGGQKKKPAKTKIHCPVMKNSLVDIAKATKSKMFSDYKGRRYFFCCAGCPSVFKANPEKFKNSESIPTPKKKGA